jgi:hypothetical protein
VATIQLSLVANSEGGFGMQRNWLGFLDIAMPERAATNTSRRDRELAQSV